MAQTSIEWSETVWNPTTGCSKVSQGCKNCYADKLHRRLQAMGLVKYSEPFNVVKTHEDALDIPRNWKKGKKIFVNSMSDLFHEDVPLAFIKEVFKVMVECPQHVFQVLTKRADRLLEVHKELPWPSNVWMGVSVEDERVIDRIDKLRNTGAKIKWISAEPLIGPLENLNLKGIDWVVVGGESGRGNIRPMARKWAVDIRKQCRAAGVAFFFKQWGGKNKKAAGRLLDGREYNEYPVIKSDKIIPPKQPKPSRPKPKPGVLHGKI